jgi:hypothetical protein
MTEHEKAYQLKETFHGALTSKECALVTVSEMLKVAWFIPDGEIYDYLLKVKEEIEKL